MTFAIVLFALNRSDKDKSLLDREIIESPALGVFTDRSASTHDLTRAVRRLGSVTEDASFWALNAADSTYSDQHRRLAVFLLFHRHVHAKSTLGEMSKKLHGAEWLTATDLQKMCALAGAWSITPTEESTVFRCFVLGESKRNWVLILHVSRDIEETELLDVMHGKPVKKEVEDAVILDVLFSPKIENIVRNKLD